MLFAVTDNPVSEIDRFDFGGPDRYTYEVAPAETPEPFNIYLRWYHCTSARVIRCLRPPIV